MKNYEKTDINQEIRYKHSPNKKFYYQFKLHFANVISKIKSFCSPFLRSDMNFGIN